MSNLSQFLAGGIRSIQRGTISLPGSSNTATISSVTTSKAQLTLLGFAVPGTDPKAYPSLELTNSTTVTARRGSGAAGTTVVGYQVVEYL